MKDVGGVACEDFLWRECIFLVTPEMHNIVGLLFVDGDYLARFLVNNLSSSGHVVVKDDSEVRVGEFHYAS